MRSGWIGLAALVLGACASPATVSNPYVATAVAPVRTLALAPGGGALGDAVAAFLAAEGFTVLPAAETAALMAQGGVRNLSARPIGGFGFLSDRGIDAVLEVQGVAPGETVRVATAFVARVPDGRRIAESQWTNRFGLPQRLLTAADSQLVASELSAGLARRLRG